MIRKPFAAFGRILYANYYDVFEEIVVNTNIGSETMLFFTEGSATMTSETGEILHLEPGMFNHKNWNNGSYTTAFELPSNIWCYDPKVNQNYVPLIEKVVIKYGESMNFPVKTNLFLCNGILEINEKSFVGPYQISVRINDIKAVAKTDVYALLFT